MSAEPQTNHGERRGVLVPAPMAWPFALAVGVALIFTGLLTNFTVSVLGAIIALFGAVGWFREVLPHEHEVLVPVQADEAAPVRQPRTVTRLEVEHAVPRAY